MESFFAGVGLSIMGVVLVAESLINTRYQKKVSIAIGVTGTLMVIGGLSILYSVP